MGVRRGSRSCAVASASHVGAVSRRGTGEGRVGEVDHGRWPDGLAVRVGDVDQHRQSHGPVDGGIGGSIGTQQGGRGAGLGRRLTGYAAVAGEIGQNGGRVG